MRSKIIIYPFVLLIKIYQILISPIIGNNCRYLPTCSEYTIESVKLHGPLKGLFLGLKRIISCHPLGGHGYDPISKQNKEKI